MSGGQLKHWGKFGRALRQNRSVVRFPVCLSAVLLLPWSAAAQVPAPMHEIALLDCSGLPCVEMTAGSGTTVRLVIDTASPNAYLDTKAAQRLRLVLQPLKSGAGGDISDVQQTTIVGAKLGDLLMGDFPFMVLDTAPDPNEPDKKRTAPLPADGALTYGSFKNRRVQLDFSKHILRVSEPQTETQPCPGRCGDLIVQHFGQYGPVTLTATGFEVAGQPVSAQIDTLFTGTVLVYPPSVEKLGFKKLSKAKSKEDFPFAQNGLKLARAEGVEESFQGTALSPKGAVYFWTSKEEPAPNVQFDVTVGTGLLKSTVFTLDLKGMHIWTAQ